MLQEKILLEETTLPRVGETTLAEPFIAQRPTVRGKFLYAGAHKLSIKGVTYGTFGPNENAEPYPHQTQVERDFIAMSANGINAIRTYTVPPLWLLNAAQRHRLRVMVGIPWEQHITFLDDRKIADNIVKKVAAGVRACARHPAILCYALGNEIPSSIVRWHGAKRIERFIERLYRAGKSEDPEALFTYVNFPTTEFLQLPFLDLVCFNVYLESRKALHAYLMRLQNLAGERPLLMGEVGLDSRRNGADFQAKTLSWQIETVFQAGCIGTFIFAWTDEWHRGGSAIEDWDFGLTTRKREPKPALRAVSCAYENAPFSFQRDWPRISVVVCSFNGAATIRDTLEGLKNLDYPDFEVIVVNDGSTDDTPRIVADYGVTLISTPNHGLSSARNTGYEAASGEIVAYIDDDAYPDPDWLRYLALAYMESDCAGVGGPNLAPPGDGEIADCVANAPGGPVHVLLTDTVAEHIPGCNMSFRKKALEQIGGFDPRYRAAGDDVDACWRIQEQGGAIGFSPSAMVWHHRRNSLSMYWKQQKGYGKAEALLEQKWPARYNRLGHASWAGRLYGQGLTVNLGQLGGRLYQGVWGSAPFQAMYQRSPNTLWSLPLMPEWYLGIAVLAVLCLLSMGSAAFNGAAGLLLLSAAFPVIQAVISARRAKFTSRPATAMVRSKLFIITAVMHLQQPLARLIGRLTHGLTPWRLRTPLSPKWPREICYCLWREEWQSRFCLLQQIQRRLMGNGALVRIGGNYEPWDLEIHGGLLGDARILTAVEEHGRGKQYFRFRIKPTFSRIGVMTIVVFGMIAILQALSGNFLGAGVAMICVSGILLRALMEAGSAVHLGQKMLIEFSCAETQGSS